MCMKYYLLEQMHQWYIIHKWLGGNLSIYEKEHASDIKYNKKKLLTVINNGLLYCCDEVFWYLITFR